MVEEKTSHSGKLIALLVCLCLAIVGLVAANIAVYITGDKKNKTTESSLDQHENILPIDYFSKGDIDGGIEAFTRQIENAQTDEEKSNLYRFLATELYHALANDNQNSQYIELMLQSAHKADDFNPTIDTAYTIYLCEDKFGDKEVAIEYLNLAKERGLPEMTEG